MDCYAISESIKRGVLSAVYLFYGSERFLIKRCIQNMQSLLLDAGLKDFNLDTLDGEKVSAHQIVSMANSMPVMSEKRMVIVHNSSSFFLGKRTEKEEQTLVDYLQNPHLGCCLVFIAEGKIDKRKRLYKALGKSGQTVDFQPLSRLQLEQWIKAFFSEKNKTLETNALEFLSLIGQTGLEKLYNEMEKLYLYLGEKPQVSLEDVQSIISKSPEIRIFDLLDSIVSSDVQKSLETLDFLLSNKEAPMLILYHLVRNYRILLLSKDMLENGFSEKDIKKRLDPIHPYALSKAIRQCRSLRFSRLVNSLEALFQTELKIKTGKGEAEGLLQSLVVDLCCGL